MTDWDPEQAEADWQAAYDAGHDAAQAAIPDWPDWELLTNDELDQLLAEAQVEKGRRENTDIEDAESGTLDDGFGNCWVKCERPDCGLEIVRPGKVQCYCDNEDTKETDNRE